IPIRPAKRERRLKTRLRKRQCAERDTRIAHNPIMAPAYGPVRQKHPFPTRREQQQVSRRPATAGIPRCCQDDSNQATLSQAATRQRQLSSHAVVLRPIATTRDPARNSFALWGVNGQAAGMSAPAAEGNRVDWASLPASIKAIIEQVLGAPVVQARTQPGG